MSYLCTVGSERRGRVFSLTNTYTFPSFALVRTREMKGIWRETDWFFNQDSTNYVEHLHEKTQSVTASNKSVIVVKVVKLISGTDRLFHFHFDNFDQSLCWRHLPLHKPTWGEQQKQISWKYAHFARQITKDAIIIYLFATISMLFETNHSF